MMYGLRVWPWDWRRMIGAGSNCARRGDGSRPAARAPAALPAFAAVLILLFGGVRFAAAAAPEQAYRFGVFPYMPAPVLDQIFGPFAAAFARDLHQPVHLKTKSTFELFAEELTKESYDIDLVDPFFYVDAADSYHYLPLARVDDDLTAVVLVPGDRAWTSWQDLAGRKLALPPALSAVSEMVMAALREHHLDPAVDVRLRHYATKMSCLHAVVFGDAAGCAVPSFIQSQLGAVDEMKLRVLATTMPIRHFVLAVHERVPPADRIRLLQCLLDLPDTAQGRAILAATAWPRFIAARDDEYDDVRRYRAGHRTLAQR